MMHKYCHPIASDAALFLCEGALCLIDEDDIWRRDMAIFANMATALKDNGRFLVTVLNAFRLVRSISDVDVAVGTIDLFPLSSRFENEVNCKEAENSRVTADVAFRHNSSRSTALFLKEG